MLILFDDDTDLLSAGTDLNEIILQVNEEIVKIHAWVKPNSLSLNIDKMNIMLFSSKSLCSGDIFINQINV